MRSPDLLKPILDLRLSPHLKMLSRQITKNANRRSRLSQLFNPNNIILMRRSLDRQALPIIILGLRLDPDIARLDIREIHGHGLDDLANYDRLCRQRVSSLRMVLGLEDGWAWLEMGLASVKGDLLQVTCTTVFEIYGQGYARASEMLVADLCARFVVFLRTDFNELLSRAISRAIRSFQIGSRLAGPQ